MKKTFLFIACIALLAASCAQPGPEPFQTGDLVFLGRYVDDVPRPQQGKDVQNPELLTFIHAGIIEIDEADSLWILDVTMKNGFKRHHFDSFLNNFRSRSGAVPMVLVKRLKDNSKVEEYVRNARKMMGQPYDFQFAPDNGALYCTELIYNSYVNEDGTHVFEEYPMNFKNADGEFIPYWVRVFDKINRPIPQDVMGTTPDGMYQSEALRPVNNSLVQAD